MDSKWSFRKKFLMPVAYSFLIVLAVFVPYGILERFWLRDTYPELINVFHVLRGIGTSLLVALFLVWYYFKSDVLDLGRKVLKFPVDHDSASTPGEFHRLFSRWLIRLRWLAVFGTFVAIYFAGFLAEVVPSISRGVRLLSLAFLLGVSNGIYYFWNRFRENYSVQNFVQMVTDLVFLTLLLHFSGGITNPLYLLYLFHVILGAIVFDNRRALAFAGMAAIFLGGLVMAESTGVLRHHSIFLGSGPDSVFLARDPSFVFSRLGVFLLILLGLVGFTITLMDILRESRGRILDETERRAELLHKVFTAQEEERARVARELHDQIGQSLSALRMKLSRLIDDREGGDAEPIEDLKTDVEERIEEVRSLSTQIRPPILDEYGLVTAVEDHVKEVDEQYEPTIEFDHTGFQSGENFSYNVDIAVYRVIQEAVHNALTHADSDRISVLLQKVGGSLRLQVYDDGRGFDVEKLLQEADRKFLGLQGMRERISHVGGDLDISSRPEQGTRVRATIPLDE